MDAPTVKEAILVARILHSGDIEISSVLPSGDALMGSVRVTLRPGESFGGRSFEEWLSIARGGQVVSADWLNV